MRATDDSVPALAILQAVKTATVQFPRLEGRGVLVPGGYVLTAAHCIGWSADGEMTLSPDDWREEIRTADKRTLSLAVVAIEPVADIAVLCAPDDQRSPDAAKAVEEWMEQTPPAPLFRGRIEPFGPALPVSILNRNRRWVRGEARVFRDGQPMISISAVREIKGGASGGPIVTAAGELVAIVSQFSVPLSKSEECEGSGACPLQALPAWIVSLLCANPTMDSSSNPEAFAQALARTVESLTASRDRRTRAKPDAPKKRRNNAAG